MKDAKQIALSRSKSTYVLIIKVEPTHPQYDANYSGNLPPLYSMRPGEETEAKDCFVKLLDLARKRVIGQKHFTYAKIFHNAYKSQVAGNVIVKVYPSGFEEWTADVAAYQKNNPS